MSTFSTGMVTFLFTDIQGSTKLWEQYPAVMQVALARHDTILRQAIESHSGHVFKTVGDAFYAAFTNAPAALSAALDAQRGLHAEAWGEAVIKVRMGLHTGAVEARDNDYFGPPLNRVARLMDAGHGGQVLLSTATEELVRGQLPPGVEVRDMGEWRLRDLSRPERIYQLIIPELPTTFPPLRGLDAIRTNLPAQLTSFVGREKEIAAIKALITTHRLTTLTGPGGTGKTRLSLQVAAELLDSFLGGIWFVEFAPLSDPAFVIQTVLTTFGLREEPGFSTFETLTNYLRERKPLLILDNCEHLIEAAAQLAERLLEACPNLRILVSSREALGIPGEAAYRVPSLSIPDVRRLPPFESFREYEAVRLFTDRAKTTLSAFAITQENATAVAQICARLDGIPLAIELAAARVRMLKVEQIAEHLDDRFRLLTGGSRTALPRQQTLRALIDWSYDLLSEPERTLLMRLSVFSGGWTLEGAESVCSDQLSVNSKQSLPTEHQLLNTDVLDLLTQLVNKSLVIVDSDDGPETRYRMLETIRQYSRDKLFESGSAEQVRDQHLLYFTQLCERAEPEFTAPDQVRWMDRLEAELDNLRTAIEWSLERDTLLGLRLAGALRWFWITHDHIRDGVEQLDQLLSQPQSQRRTAIRAKALATYSEVVNYTDDNVLPITLAEESLSIYQELEDPYGIADSLLALAGGYFQDLEKSRKLIEQSLALYDELDDKPGLARALGIHGAFSENRDVIKAKTAFEKSLKICREIGHIAGIGSNLIDLGMVAIREGDYAAAHTRLGEALQINRPLGKIRTAETLTPLAALAYREGDYLQARAAYEETLSIRTEYGQMDETDWISARLGYVALRLRETALAKKLFFECVRRFKEVGSRIGIAFILEGLASMAVGQNQPERAAQLYAWADVTRELFHDSRPSFEQQDVDRDLAIIRSQLDEAAFAAAQAAGRAMSVDEAMAYALETGND